MKYEMGIFGFGMAVSLATTATAIAQVPVVGAPTSEVAAAPPSAATGTIVIYRGSSLMGAGIACPVRYKGSEIVELGRGKFARWTVAPGHYILTNKTASVNVVVGPGETGYVRCSIKPGFMTGRSDLQIVDAESFVEHQADFKEKEIVAPASSSAEPVAIR